jgi:hypothetical protein
MNISVSGHDQLNSIRFLIAGSEGMSGVYINFMEYPDINSLYEDQSIN